LLAAALGRGELEQLVMQVLGEAYSAKNIIICLVNAELFFSEGVGSVDLTNVLLPILEAGRLRLILSLDEQRLLQIGQRNPGLVNAINRINVSPTGFDETMLVLEDHLILTEFERKVTFTYQSLKEAYRLSERYIYDLAMPGRAIKLLDSAAAYAENGLVTMNSVQNAIEQTLDVKVGVADNAAERSKLINLEDLIHQRMIDQSRAVQVVSDALRRARAGVRNESRPIGTFLFLGPTGVGKTELAKALAATYFDGEDKIIRLDLNEYVSPNDVGRLIADGADNPMSLTAQVMKQPFSVILLDEIEKAHPNVLTTLLQALDEGILRDIKNRDISFRDAIVIATSNAGAERIREYIERGYKLDQFEQQFIDELISSGQFRPEFLNRFDEIVLFRPLGKEELMQVLDLMVTGVNKTLALQHISVTVDDDAKTLLVEAGYDPRLGARPMRRIVQRTVENLVAKQMLAGAVAPGGVIRISRQQVAAIVDITSQADAIAASS
jgi:ATP-dependent Clp protease ATP-binding subunit ClpC